MARPAISIAAEAGDLDALRRELTRGVAVDLEDPSGNTALQLVCGTHNADLSLEDRIACVKMLLEHGAAPNAGLPNNPGHGTVVEDHPGDVKRMLDLVGLQITYVCWISEGASAE